MLLKQIEYSTSDLKGLSPCAPLEREKLSGIVESTIPKVIFLSIGKYIVKIIF